MMKFIFNNSIKLEYADCGGLRPPSKAHYFVLYRFKWTYL